MTFMIWGVSIVMTVNVKVAYATHEAPFPSNDSGVQAGMRTASERERS
jgi:hypothetical protein